MTAEYAETELTASCAIAWERLQIFDVIVVVVW